MTRTSPDNRTIRVLGIEVHLHPNANSIHTPSIHQAYPISANSAGINVSGSFITAFTCCSTFSCFKSELSSSWPAEYFCEWIETYSYCTGAEVTLFSDSIDRWETCTGAWSSDPSACIGGGVLYCWFTIQYTPDNSCNYLWLFAWRMYCMPLKHMLCFKFYREQGLWMAFKRTNWMFSVVKRTVITF